MRTVLLLAAAGLLCVPSKAQETPPDSTNSHFRAAIHLMDVMGMEDMIMGNTEGMMRQMTAGMPMAPPEGMIELMLEFFEEIYIWEELEPEFAAIYVDLYTEEELLQVADFYQSPLGERMLETQMEATLRGAAITQRIAQENMGLLMERMSAFMQAQQNKQ